MAAHSLCGREAARSPVVIGAAIILLTAWLWCTCVGLSSTARGRLYKSGTIWCFWRWTDVESEYILRLHVLKTPWFAVCLHWIRKPDKEPWLHDHPVSFPSIILRGSYAELRWNKDKGLHHKVSRWFNFIRDTDRHRIIFTRANTLTLCFMGPKTREWGFYVGDLLQPAPTTLGPAGWLYWKDYYARLKDGEDLRCGPLGLFDKVLEGHYTEQRVAALAGAPIGSVRDADVRPVDDGAPDDFEAEAPTNPRGGADA